MYSEKVAILGVCMKKIFFLFLFSICSTVSFAESMQFLTLLSHPVGSFAKLELQTNRQADIFQLNFCNGFINGGSINIGTETTPGSIEIQNLKMGANTKLLGNIAQYQVGSTEISAGATAKVKELYVNNNIEVNPDSEKDFFVKDFFCECLKYPQDFPIMKSIFVPCNIPSRSTIVNKNPQQ